MMIQNQWRAIFSTTRKVVVICCLLVGTNLAARAQANLCEKLCADTKMYCDQMHVTTSLTEQKELAVKALDVARRAVAADTNNAKAHLCLAVAYVKNFQLVDTRTAVSYSRLLKAETETAIRIDPTNDVAYYLLGRWHYGVANMNFIYKGLVKLIYGGLPFASNADAEKNFKQAIQLAPTRIIHHLELAKTYHVTGQKKLAQVELEQCETLAPVDQDDTDAKKWAAEILRTGDWP